MDVVAFTISIEVAAEVKAVAVVAFTALLTEVVAPVAYTVLAEVTSDAVIAVVAEVIADGLAPDGTVVAVVAVVALTTAREVTSDGAAELTAAEKGSEVLGEAVSADVPIAEEHESRHARAIVNCIADEEEVQAPLS